MTLLIAVAALAVTIKLLASAGETRSMVKAPVVARANRRARGN